MQRTRCLSITLQSSSSRSPSISLNFPGKKFVSCELSHLAFSRAPKAKRQIEEILEAVQVRQKTSKDDDVRGVSAIEDIAGRASEQ